MSNDTEIGGLSCVLLQSLSELEAIANEWTTLLAGSETNEPMQSPIWLTNWWRVYGGTEGRQLCVLVMRRGTSLVGIAPFCRRKVRYLRSLPLNRMELLGSGEREEDETCSEYIGLIALRGEEQAVATTFGLALHGGFMGQWDEVRMPAMSSQAVITPLVAHALGMAGVYAFESGAPFVQLPSSWDDYMSGMSSSRRYLIRRSVKAWTKWAGSEPKLMKVTGESDFDHGFDILANLHAQRWKDKGHVGAFTSPLFESFHRQTMRDLLRVGALWLCWLEVDGKPVVALYNIVWNKQVRFYQSGRLLDLPSKVRAGLVIHACAIREAIEQGYTHYDFLAGTTRYKMQLANNVRPLVELTVDHPGARTRLKDMGTASLDIARSVRDEWKRRFTPDEA